MTGKAKLMRPVRLAGTLEGIRPGESLDDFERRVGDDIPEMTEELFRNAKPIAEFPELAQALESARKALRGQRGPQKAPVKSRVTLRLDRDIIERYRAGGPGWQTRINDDLAQLQKRKKHG